MPLFKGCGCKGKPAKAIDYITDEKKAAIVTSYALDDNRDYTQQFAETAKLFGKAQKYNSRKYYHFKHSFDPKDNITPEEAHRLTEELAQQAFPDNEYIIATHTDKNHIHCHIIVNSVSFVNGKMLHYSKDEYGRLKDRSNEIAAKYGYSTSEKGITLRINRSMQVEGAFGVLKEDYGFRRFLTRGKKNVKTEMLFHCFAYNFKKYYNKIIQKRTKTYLFEKKKPNEKSTA